MRTRGQGNRFRASRQTDAFPPWRAVRLAGDDRSSEYGLRLRLGRVGWLAVATAEDAALPERWPSGGRPARRSRVGQGQGGQALGPAGTGKPATAAAASCASAGSRCSSFSASNRVSPSASTTRRRTRNRISRARMIWSRSATACPCAWRRCGEDLTGKMMDGVQVSTLLRRKLLRKSQGAGLVDRNRIDKLLYGSVCSQ